MGVDPRVDRLVADRAPIGCWGVGHGAHLATRFGLEAPADLAGRSAPGEVGHDTGPQNRVGIDGALLGTGTSACGHAPRLLAPVAPVGARVALDLAADHRRGPAEHSGDARLAQPRLQPRTDRSTVLHTQRPTTTHTQPLSTRKPAHTL